MELFNLNDYEIAAKKKMDTACFDYYAGGSDDEVTLRENRSAYERIKLQSRVLRGIGECDMEIDLLGHRLAAPILIAPTAMHGLADDAGELATARAVAGFGGLMIQSTTSTYGTGEIVSQAPGKLWFQLYIHRNRQITKWLIQNAERSGCTALVVTVDTPVLGNRERDRRNNFSVDAFRNKIHLLPGEKEKSSASLSDYAHSELKSAASWEDIDWIRSVSSLPILLKGIGHPEDARLAVEHGMAGIIVSNHGGRQLDGGLSTIELLPRVCSAVGGRIPVLVDGGIRRGTDILKALASGASAVAVGRPILWGLSVDGEAGVRCVLEILRDELRRAMQFCGIEKISEINRDLLFI